MGPSTSPTPNASKNLAVSLSSFRYVPSNATFSRKRSRDETSSTRPYSVRSNTAKHEPSDSCYNLIDFLKQLGHQSYFDALYQDAGVVLALFRSLHNVDKLIVLRLLDISDPVRWEPFIIWHGGDRKSTIRALNNLRSLRVILISQQRMMNPAAKDLRNLYHSGSSHVSQSSNKERSSTVSKPSTSVSAGDSILSKSSNRFSVETIRYQLHPVFQKTLKVIFSKGFAAISIAQSKSPKHYPTRETLHAHAVSQWIQLSHWLIQRTFLSRNAEKSDQESLALLNPDLFAVVEHLGLCQPNTALSSSSGNPLGDVSSEESLFDNRTLQWLFNDRQKQISSLCIEYVKAVHCGVFVSFECGVSESEDTATKEISHQNTTKLAFSQVIPTYPNDVVSRQTIEVFSLLLTLSEVLIGQPCSMVVLTASQKRFIRFAYSIGLVWLHKPIGSKHFFPTPLAKFLQTSSSLSCHVLSSITHLTSSLATMGETIELPVPQPLFDTAFAYQNYLSIPPELYDIAYDQFFNQDQNDDCDSTTKMVKVESSVGIIVESNFKVYAYVTKAFSCVPILLAYLCEIKVIMPCMIVAIMSRQRIMKAYKAGVTANQIIQFFTVHAHPSIYFKAYREGRPLVPDNVVSQLKIWEGERHRVTMTPACLFEFSKDSDLEIFSLAVNRAHGSWLIMNSELPSSSNPTSTAFLTWKNQLLEKKKATVHGNSSGGLSWCPVLAIHVEFKDQLIEFIRNATRSITRTITKYT